MKKITFVFAALLVLAFCGCKKNDNQNTVYCSDNGQIHYVAVVYPDVCQLLVSVDNNLYVPLALDSTFLTDSLKVKLCYTFTGDSQYCGFINYKYRQIDIKSIQKK